MERLRLRRIDPFTGNLHSLDQKSNLPEAVQIRLTHQKQDEEEVVRTRYHTWTNSINFLEEHFRNCLIAIGTSKTPESLAEEVSRGIEAPKY